MKYKIATTEQILENEELVEDRNYNRYLSHEYKRMLLPEGIHLCTFYMEHFHAQGILVPKHYRTVWKLAARGGVMLAVQLDWDADLFEALETYEES